MITAGEEASDPILQGREPPQYTLIPGAIGMSGYLDNRLRIVMVSIVVKLLLISPLPLQVN